MVMTPHPAEADFDRLANGDVSPEDFERFAAHFEECAACARRFDEQTDGTLLETVRRSLLDQDPLLDESGCETLTTWLDQGLSAESERRAALNEGLPPEIGDYRLDRMIGCGGMGVVYRATHHWLNRTVALKLLNVDKGIGPSSIQQFTREFEAIGRLDHPNIVRALDAGCRAGQAYLAMELVDGIDLAKVRRALRTLPANEVAEIAWEAAAGLQHAHENGIIHRDIKPSNLMLARDGNSGLVSVKVMDLGLVRIESAVHSDDEAASRILGTRGYQSPEQSQGTTIDQRSDVYSLGATMLSLLADRPVHELEEWVDSSPEVDPKFVGLLRRMLSASPTNRPAEMTDVQSELQPLRSGADLSACLNHAETAAPSSDLNGFSWSVLTERSMAAGNVGDRGSASPRNRTVFIAVAVLLSLVLAIAIWLIPSETDTSTQTDSQVPSGRPNLQESEPAISLEHDVARRVIALGGRFDAIGDENDMSIDSVENIPDGPFRIDWIMLEHTAADDEILTPISQLQHLRGIGLSYTNVTDVGVRLLGKCQSLENLLLYSTGVGDAGLETVVRLPRLEELIVSVTEITNKTLAGLSDSRNLKILNMKDTAITGEGLEHLAGLPRLIDIDLRGCSIGDTDIPRLLKLTKLRALYLDKTVVSEQGLSQLAELPELRYLQVWGAEISESAAARLRQLMPNCQIEREID